MIAGMQSALLVFATLWQ